MFFGNICGNIKAISKKEKMQKRKNRRMNKNI